MDISALIRLVKWKHFKVINVGFFKKNWSHYRFHKIKSPNIV